MESISSIIKSQLGKTLSEEDAVPNSRQEGARSALIIFSGINLLNFADRFVPGM